LGLQDPGMFRPIGCQLDLGDRLPTRYS